MSFSNLVDYVKISPNKTSPRTEKIRKITVHHAAAVTTVAAMGSLFSQKSRQASSNYGIDSEGRIACYVEEEDRAWTSGSWDNDIQAVTIEVANSAGGPDWPISNKAWEALVDLCADICQRHGFRLNFTGDKTGSLTIHKFFQSTACPGPYLEARMPQLAGEVNARLAGDAPKKDVFYRVQVGAFNDLKKATSLRDKLKAAGYSDAFIVEVSRK